jgi:nucleotide-binding universal stress UspA family protein
MYKTILAPLDGSKQSEAILGHLKNLARQYKSKVIFLKVEEEPVMLGWDEVVDMERCHADFEKRRKAAESYLAAITEQFQKESIEACMKIAYGSVVKAILNTADDVQADLIAMTCHGFNSLHRMSFGGAVTAVLQNFDRPLFILRTPDKRQ